MKFLKALLFTVLVCTGVIIDALRFIEPLDAIVRSKYSTNFGDLKTKCDSKDPNLYKDLTELQSKEGEIRAHLTAALIAKARSQGQGNLFPASEAEQWIQENCITNSGLLYISNVAIDKIQLCVDPVKQLQGAEVDNAKKDFLNGLCGAVSMSAAWVYMNNL